jgi:hypothetical protein
VSERGGVGRGAVVRAAPGREVQLAREAARGRVAHAGHEPLDHIRRELAREVLGAVQEIASIVACLAQRGEEALGLAGGAVA